MMRTERQQTVQSQVSRVLALREHFLVTDRPPHLLSRVLLARGVRVTAELTHSRMAHDGGLSSGQLHQRRVHRLIPSGMPDNGCNALRIPLAMSSRLARGGKTK